MQSTLDLFFSKTLGALNDKEESRESGIGKVQKFMGVGFCESLVCKVCLLLRKMPSCLVVICLCSRACHCTSDIWPSTVMIELKLFSPIINPMISSHVHSQSSVLVWREPLHLTGVSYTARFCTWVGIASSTVVPMPYSLVSFLFSWFKTSCARISNRRPSVLNFELRCSSFNSITWEHSSTSAS